MENRSEIVAMTADIVSAFVSANPVEMHEIAGLIETVHGALLAVTVRAEAKPNQDQIPAVPIRRSVQPDFIICLEDGKSFKSLKRHLRTRYGMTPEEYRAKWGLPVDYPMVAPNYAEARSRLAKQKGLGKKKRGDVKVGGLAQSGPSEPEAQGSGKPKANSPREE